MSQLAAEPINDPDSRFIYREASAGILDPRIPVAVASPSWITLANRCLICAVILISVGCGPQAGPREFSEEEIQARREALLKAHPLPPADTPEQIREKEEKVEATLPEVYALLEDVKADPARVDELVDLSMSLLTLVPNHREAKVAYLKSQLASFYAKEGQDHFNALVAINSAILEADRLRENFGDLSDEELQVCQDVYFNQARREGYFPHSEDAFDVFRVAMDKLMKSGFDDAERLKAEPKFEYFFSNPKFAAILDAAIAQIEGSAEDDSSEQ
ncbi:MAG: hypothetical protein KDA93_06990 [Planctomycetaceae bacterium]|nr:hypothetical protein [Planctomycetaceae bacterium]